VNNVDTLNGQLVAHAGPIYDFQWIDCLNNTPIPGATDSILTFPGNGEYAVVISNGECSDTSDCFDLTTLGVNEIVNRFLYSLFRPITQFRSLRVSP
jgi:hypothetical protein